MDRIKLKSGGELSRIIYGMWRIGDDENTSPKHIEAKINACLEQGITTIDQADIYGDYGAEALLGKCFRESPSLVDSVEIITKCDIVAPCGRHSDKRVKYYDTSAAYINQSVETSLKLMNLEKIDLLLIHRPDPFMDHHETGRALDVLVDSGKVSAIGVSNFKPHDWTLLQSAMSHSLVTNQIEISLLANDAFTNGDIPFLQENTILPMAWSPLGGGRLFNESGAELIARMTELAEENACDLAALAVAWLLAHPAKIAPVMGTNNLERIKQLSAASRVSMDRETWFELYGLANGHEVP